MNEQNARHTSSADERRARAIELAQPWIPTHDGPAKTDREMVTALHGADVAELVAEQYPAALPLLANGWTVDSALNHVQGVCDQMLCTGDHGGPGDITSTAVALATAVQSGEWDDLHALADAVLAAAKGVQA